MTLASMFSKVGRFESYLIVNLEDRFSHDEARFFVSTRVTLAKSLHMKQNQAYCAAFDFMQF